MTPFFSDVGPVARDVPTDTVADDVALWLFLRSLRASRLVPAADADALEREFGPDRVADLCRFLADEGVLTPYQIGRLRRGQPDGLVVGRYHVLDELGRGGFGQVYKARHQVMDRVVALKVLCPERVAAPGGRELMLREVRAATRVVHPNVAAAFDADEVDGVFYYAMEYVPGPTLERYVIDHGPLPVADACGLAREVAAALGAAHAGGLVHRDLKPANLLLQGAVPPELAVEGVPPFTAKVVDLGLARLTGPAEQPFGTILCSAGGLVGTPAFMAPEQARDPHAADGRSDLYSLGCTFYYALTGRPPFAARSIRDLLLKHAREEPVPIRSHGRDVPEPVARVVHRLLAKDPADRYQTPSEFVEALDFACRLDRVGGDGFRHDDPPAAPPSEPPSHPAPPAEPPAPPSPTPAAAVPERVSEVALGPTAADARRLWREWYAAVAPREHGSGPAVGGRQYKALHRAALAAIRAAADSPAPDSAGWRRAEAVVEPWLTDRSLAELDRRSAAQLLQECSRLDAELFPAGTARGVRLWPWVVGGSLLAAATAYLFT